MSLPHPAGAESVVADLGSRGTTDHARALDAVLADPRRGLACVLADLARLGAIHGRRGGPSGLTGRGAPAAPVASVAPAASVASTLHRAASHGYLELEQIRVATGHARAAVRAARLARDRRAEGLARVALARALTFGGALGSATAELDRAERLLEGPMLGTVHVQRSATSYKAGRVRDALELSNRALRTLGDGPHLVAERARALNNRAVMRLYLGGYQAGLADLEEAEQLLRARGLVALAAQVAHNRGMMLARVGEIPAALVAFDEARGELEHLGLPTQRLAVDRAELLLWVRLGAEAAAGLERALVDLEAGGSAVDAAEGLVYLAQALLMVGDPRAGEVAAEARDRYRRAGSPGWAAIAGLVEAQAAAANGPAVDVLRRARRAAGALQRAGLHQYAAEASLLAGRLAAAIGRAEEATRHLVPLAGRRRTGPAHLRARAWEAEARLRLLRGDRRAAARAVDAGLGVLEDHRAALGASDLRARASGHGTELAALGLDLALASGSAGTVLRWAERWRAGALRLPPVRPPDDSRLAELLAALRQASAEVAEAELAGRPTAVTERRVVELEARIRRATRQRTGEGANGDPADARFGADERRHLREVVGGRALVELCEHGEHLAAVVVTDRRCRLVRLGPLEPVLACRDALGFALRRLIRTGAAPRPTPGPEGASRLDVGASRAGALLARAVEDLRARLLTPLGRLVGERDLVVVPTASLHALPWGMVAGADGRAVSVAPSAGLWLRAVERSHSDGRGCAGAAGGVGASDGGAGRVAGPVVVAAGPGLPGAAEEVARVAAIHAGSTLLAGSQATAASVLAALDGAGLAHLAAHGVLRRDNPLFSAVQLADGPATVYDLERLARAPRRIVLSACDSAVHEVVAGDELLGLAAALLSLGTSTVVASVLPLPDGGTVGVMAQLHEQLAAGRRPAAALAAVRLAHDASADPAGWAAAASLVCLGAG